MIKKNENYTILSTPTNYSDYFECIVPPSDGFYMVAEIL